MLERWLCKNVFWSKERVIITVLDNRERWLCNHDYKSKEKVIITAKNIVGAMIMYPWL